jgi:RHS repeat-associated protein
VIVPSFIIELDSRGYVGYLRQTEVDPGGLGIRTRYETDARGNVTAVIGPRGVRHETEFNALDWPVETRRATSGSSDDSTSDGSALVPDAAAPPLGYVQRQVYDRNGNLAEVRIPFGAGGQSTLQRYTYGELDELLVTKRQIMPSDPESQWTVEVREYDKNLNLKKVIDPVRHVVEADYDLRNLVTETRSGLGTDPLAEPIIETYSFNNDRELDLLQDGRGNPWANVYDGYGRLRDELDPLGNKRRSEYDDNGNPIRQRAFDASDTLLAESAAAYDRLDRQVESSNLLWETDSGSATALTATLVYDRMSNVKQVIDPLGRVTTYEYDDAERLIKTQDPLGNRQELVLDKAGNVRMTKSFEIDPEGETTEVVFKRTYDALNRPSKSMSSVCKLVAVGDPPEPVEECNTVQTFYDARDQLVRVVDEEHQATVYLYDGLDRLTREVKPEGITIDYTYDVDSQLEKLEDARGNATEYAYDAVHRRTAVTYPDSTTQSFTYDDNHNLTGWVDPRGHQITQLFDAANRLERRTIEAGQGPLEGPSLELYEYDGLHRLTEAHSTEPSSADVVTRLVYDSLSRLISEETLGRTVVYTHDHAGNVTQLGYPSGAQVGREVDALNRLSRIGTMAVLEEGQPPEIDPQRAARHDYRGRWLIDTIARGNGLTTRSEAWDAARRPLQVTTQSPSQVPAVSERLRWSPRGLKSAISRDDANGFGWILQQDGASRMLRAGVHPNPADLVQDNETASPEALSESELSFGYEYDAAQHLVSSESDFRGDKQTTAMAQDDPADAKRNRPSRIGNIPLDWDATGNLIQKGPLSFSYDYRNRLTRVSDSGTEVARYKYDLFNRRVQKLFPAPTPSEEVAWSGWQELEHYRNGQLTSRSVFGSGLDEIVHSQWDLDFDGQLETDFYPVYDHTGNLAALVNQSGRTVASYVYSPFGEDFRVLVDEIPPAIQQLRVGPPDLIRFEFDGELWLGALETGIENGEVTVTLAEPPPGEVSTAETSKTAGVKSLSLSATQPIVRGREARRRVELTVADPPAPGTEVQLTIARSAVRDLFGNQLAEDLEVTFLWPETAELLVEDTTPPEITEIFLRDGHVEVTLSETPEMTLVPAAFQIDGGTTTWTLLDDTYTIRSEQPLSPGTHLLQVDPSNPIDLAGLGVASLFEQELTIDDPAATLADPQKESGQAGDSLIYSATDPRIVPLTALANRATFHGRPLDVETGLLYFRNRYYDPEMGRFITTDPLGYVDGPSMYQFASNDPIDFRDPMGLHDSPWMLIREKDQLREAGIDDPQAAARAAARRQREEEIALQATLFASHLNAQSYDWGQDQSVLNDNAFWFFRGEGQTTQNAALSSGIVLGAQECDASSVFCNVDWKSAAAVAKTGDFVVGASLLVFDPLAAPGIADDFVRWADDLNSFRGANNVPRGGIWTATKSKSAAQNAFRHFKDHGADFGARNAVEFVEQAQQFLRSPPPGTLTRVRPNGDVVRYNPGTDTFGVMDASGAPRTLFKPDPAVHGYPTNLDYFNAQ